MAHITLPISTIRPDGIFFNQVTEAIMRGGKILYHKNDALICLPDDRFFTIQDVNNVLDNNGEVEIFPLHIVIPEDIYKNGKVPSSIAIKLGYETIIEDDNYKAEYTWAEIFSHVNIKETEEDTSDVEVSLSTNNEWIKASIAKEIANYLKVELI